MQSLFIPFVRLVQIELNRGSYKKNTRPKTGRVYTSRAKMWSNSCRSTLEKGHEWMYVVVLLYVDFMDSFKNTTFWSGSFTVSMLREVCVLCTHLKLSKRTTIAAKYYATCIFTMFPRVTEWMKAFRFFENKRESKDSAHISPSTFFPRLSSSTLKMLIATGRMAYDDYSLLTFTLLFVFHFQTHFRLNFFFLKQSSGQFNL